MFGPILFLASETTIQATTAKTVLATCKLKTHLAKNPRHTLTDKGCGLGDLATTKQHSAQAAVTEI